MDFVNDVDLVTRGKRSQRDMALEFAYFVHTVVRRAVDLDDVEAFSSRNGEAILALAARFVPICGSTAVERLCDQPSDRRFAASTGPGKKIGMPRNGALEPLDKNIYRCGLSRDFGEFLRTISSIK
jgi:hypothetical protein